MTTNSAHKEIKRIGVLTGGGDCPGLNAVIRAVYRAAHRLHGWEVLGIANGFEGLIDLERSPGRGNRWLSQEIVRGMLPRGGTILGASNRANPFAYVNSTGAAEHAAPTDVSDKVVENIRHLGLDALVCIGGDGTMVIAQQLAQKGVDLVGIPKTIDNDLSATDYTFGFNTAVQTAVDAIDKLHTTAESHERVIFIEVMGRNTGWIALHAGIAGGADVILLPEIPYCTEAICAHIARRRAQGTPFAIVVVAEGARAEGGAESYLPEHELGRARRLGGAAERVAAAVSSKIGLEHRVTVLGHLQRGGPPNPFDRLLATRFGTTAVDLLSRRQFGHMVCFHHRSCIAVPIAEAVSRVNLVDPREELILSGRAIGTSFGSRDELTS